MDEQNRTATVIVRIKPAARDLIDSYATAADVNRSEMIRRLLSEALTARQKKR